MKKILIDPGHGGADPGSSANGLLEKHVNLIIGNYLRNELSNYECITFMTRDQDITVSNEDRIAMATGKDLYISLHNNWFGDPSANGWESFRYSGSLLETTKKYHNDIHNMLLPLMNELGVRERRGGPATANFWMLREPRCSCVLIEYVFLSNPREASLLKNDDILLRLGRQTALGIVKALNLKKKSAISRKVITIARGLNLRTGPDTSHSILTVLPRDTILDVIGEFEEWLNVRTLQGITGWVHGYYTERYIEARKVIVTVSTLHFRQSPTTLANNIIRGLHRGTVVEVINTRNEWLEVKTSTNEVGWIHGDYVKDFDDSHIVVNHNVVEYLLEKNWRITSDFGWRTHPISGKRTFHNGIDFGVPRGGVINAPIPTPFPCRVTQNRFIASRGNTQVSLITGTKVLQLFQHLHSFRNKNGDRLNVGDIIGLCGTTGDSTGVHLHYELRINDGSIIGSPIWGDPKNFRLGIPLSSGLHDPIYTVVVGDYPNEHTALEALQDILDRELEGQILPYNNRYRIIANNYATEQVATIVSEGLRDIGYKNSTVLVR